MTGRFDRPSRVLARLSDWAFERHETYVMFPESSLLYVVSENKAADTIEYPTLWGFLRKQRYYTLSSVVASAAVESVA